MSCEILLFTRCCCIASCIQTSQISLQRRFILPMHKNTFIIQNGSAKLNNNVPHTKLVPCILIHILDSGSIVRSWSIRNRRIYNSLQNIKTHSNSFLSTPVLLHSILSQLSNVIAFLFVLADSKFPATRRMHTFLVGMFYHFKLMSSQLNHVPEVMYSKNKNLFIFFALEHVFPMGFWQQ